VKNLKKESVGNGNEKGGINRERGVLTSSKNSPYLRKWNVTGGVGRRAEGKYSETTKNKTPGDQLGEKEHATVKNV